MGLLDSSRDTFEKAFYLALFFTLFFTILDGALTYSMGISLAKDETTNPNGIPLMTWGTDQINNAVGVFKQGAGVNLIVAVPMFAGALLSVIIQILINTIALSQYLIKLAIEMLLKFIILEPSYVSSVSNILAWIVEAPILIGMGATVGNIIFMFWPGGVNK